MRYAIVIEKAGNNFSGYVPDLPGCVATGATVQDTEAGAGRIHERVVEAGELCRQRAAVGYHDPNVRRAETTRVLLQLASTPFVDLDGGNLATKHRRLSSGRSAKVERPLAGPCADREANQLRR